MSVILKEQLDHLGYQGEEVTVTPGYARNWLIPQQLAVYATQKNRDVYKVTLSAEEAAQKTQERAQNVLKARIAASGIVFKRATNDDVHLYGPVTAADIVEALENTELKNLRIREQNVHFAPENSSRSFGIVGVHTVFIEPARQFPGLMCPLEVTIMNS